MNASRLSRFSHSTLARAVWHPAVLLQRGESKNT
jgi:hypothetical protein